MHISKMFWGMAAFHIVVIVACLWLGKGLAGGLLLFGALVALSYFNRLDVDPEDLRVSRDIVFYYRGTNGPIVWPFARIPQGYWAAVAWFGQDSHIQSGGIALIPLFFGEMRLVSIQKATDNVAENVNDAASTRGIHLYFTTRGSPVRILLNVTLSVFETPEAVRRMAYGYRNPAEPRDALLSRASEVARAFCGPKTDEQITAGTGSGGKNEALKELLDKELADEAVNKGFPMKVSAGTASILPEDVVLAAKAEKAASTPKAEAGKKLAEVIGAEAQQQSEGELRGLRNALENQDGTSIGVEEVAAVTNLTGALAQLRAGTNADINIAGRPEKVELDLGPRGSQQRDRGGRRRRDREED